eukprot:CAMPEP_0182547338 /NCGR_PEP_ID=MMETSP1323-20130603/37317_1 /TAXON_ID=236787 /ORGANISM="Florenciella parvula, Strain RCC1693" /LENGTH=84 /DNA_ID=CAMNT_0024758639 /DNA_START=94 /DNA_END=348 /DNA_ORIENTATION=+
MNLYMAVQRELARRDLFIALLAGGVHGPKRPEVSLADFRGGSMTDTRMRIADCLGIRTGSDLRKLREASTALGNIVDAGGHTAR